MTAFQTIAAFVGAALLTGAILTAIATAIPAPTGTDCWATTNSEIGFLRCLRR